MPEYGLTSTGGPQAGLLATGSLQPSLSAPNIGNLYVGRGYLQAKFTGETSFTDMGNCTRFTFQTNTTRLDHYSSRVGVRKKDLTVVTQLDAKLTMTLEELTVRNLAMFVLGTPLESSADSINLMSQPLFYCSLQFIATNVVGPQWNAVFPLVLLTPTNAMQMIAEGSGTWGSMEMEGDVQFDSASQQYGWLYSNSFQPAH
jgi:hypothetical protein